MTFETLLVKEAAEGTTVTINQSNINSILLKELHQALDIAENKEGNLFVLQGQPEVFCTGMDFKEMIAWDFATEKISAWASNYISLLNRFATSSRVIVTKLDGKVIAGGIGLVAASDFVVATSRTTFKLTEALWGLLPAMVAPYLIRRIGFQKAYSMTLLAKTITAQEAFSMHLVDELNEETQELQRFHCLNPSTILELKAYFRKMWIVDNATEKTAVEEISKLLQNPQVKTNIHNFVESGKLPWK